MVNIALAAFFSTIVGGIFGIVAAQSKIEASCEKLGSFYVKESVFECKKIAESKK